MASGDIVNDIDSVNNGASVDFQPAAGVEIMITSGGADSSSTGNTIGQTDSTLFAIAAVVGGGGGNGGGVNISLFINNTVFLRRNNTSGGTRIMSFTGYTI